MEPVPSTTLRPSATPPKWSGGEDTVQRTQRICRERGKSASETDIQRELGSLHNVLSDLNAFRHIPRGPFAVLVSRSRAILSTPPSLSSPTILFGEEQYGYAQFMSAVIADRLCSNDPPPPPAPATNLAKAPAPNGAVAKGNGSPILAFCLTIGAVVALTAYLLSSPISAPATAAFALTSGAALLLQNQIA